MMPVYKPRTLADITREVWMRNALRQQALLPLLNVRSEVRHLAALERDRAYQSHINALEHLRPVLIQKLVARERRRRNDPKFLPMMGLQWSPTVQRYVRKVLERIVRMRTGVLPPRG